uniref:Uncharacterized protein n=1 Tax=Anguilla anguilla TaxID=7936 RepID=A0A0E9SRQ3_ANGAN
MPMTVNTAQPWLSACVCVIWANMAACISVNFTSSTGKNS